MKFLVLCGDGMADFPLAELGGKTPLEMSNTPAMDAVAKTGIVGLFCPIPEDLTPGSDIGNLSLFGYDPHTTYPGRAPLEAARQGISLRSDQVVFRCNLVTLLDGVMASFTSGHIPTEQARDLIHALNEAFASEGVQFHCGVSYRHLAVVSARDFTIDAFLNTKCTPPHDISDKPYAPHLPQGPAGEALQRLMEKSRSVLSTHPVNEERRRAGLPPATSIWLWGQGKSAEMESYQRRFGLTGTVISAVDLVKGIGVCAGLNLVDVPGATGYLDTNYAGKVEAALAALETQDFVYLHVEAPDETAHEGRIDLKIKAIEQFDRHVVTPCFEYAQRRGDCRLFIAPDHITAISTKTHAHGPVPFAAWGPGVDLGGSSVYSESAGRASGILVRQGHRLVPHLLTTAHVTVDSIRSLDESYASSVNLCASS